MIYIIIACFVLPLYSMTIEEKVGQVLMVHFKGESANAESDRLIKELHVGGIIYYKWANGLHSPSQVKELSKALQQSAKIPLLIAVDQEGGRVNRLTEGFVTFPANREVKSVEEAYQNALKTGLQLANVGINMNFAPVVDVDSNPTNPVIGNRSFSPDPKVVACLGHAALRGYKEAKIIPVLKHFPGHGDTSVDSHTALPYIYKSLKELKAVELYPFQQLMPYASVIMTAHIVIPAIDQDHSATLSKRIITDLLRKEMGFNGMVITDSLVMAGVNCNIEEAALRALNAGCDMLCLGGKQLRGQDSYELTSEDIARVHHSLVMAVKNGTLSEERLNEAVGRVLARKNVPLPLAVPLPLPLPE